MASREFTYLFCLDEKRRYSGEIKQRFNDSARYEVLVCQSHHEFLNLVSKYRSRPGFRVAILPLGLSHDQLEPSKSTATEIRKLSPDISIILLVSGDNPEDMVQKAGIDIYSWVPSTNNSVLRIHNSVKKLISEKVLTQKTLRVRRILRVLFAFLIVCVLVLIFCRIRFPQYF